MLFILDKSFNVVEVLSNVGDFSKIIPYYDDLYTQDLVTGAETFEFTTTSNNEKSQHLTIGNYIAFKYEDDYKLFNIINITEDHNQTLEKTVYCEMAGIELINHVIRPMKVNNNTVKKFLDAILSDTDWQTGRIEAGLTQVIDFEISEHKSVYELIQEHIVGTFGAEIAYRVEISNGQLTGKYIDVYNNRGKENGYRFAYSKNIETISRTVDSSELVTALIGQGNNGLTFKDLDIPDKPINQDFIASETAYRQWNLKGSHLMGVHKCDTDSAHELLRLTRIALEERSQPKIKYEVKVLLIDKNIKIGDTVNIIDHEFNPPLYITGRVTQLKLSKTDPNKNECVLSNFKEVRSNITPEMRKLASQLEGYVDNQFPIGGDKIQNGAVGKDQFSKEYHTELIADAVHASLVETEELIANKANIGDLEAINASIENLKATDVTISGKLTAADAEIKNLKSENIQVSGKLEATYAEIEKLKAVDIDVSGKLTAVEGDIGILNSNIANVSGKLTATEAEINLLKSDVAEIDTLLAGNITGENIQGGSITAHELASGTITAGSGVIADGAIGNAQISSLDASKISAGTVDTSKVTIQGADGHLRLKGNRLQVFQGVGNQAVERVSVGDVNGNGSVYGLRVRGADGQTVLLDENGVKSEGITDGAITNDKISENANIDGNKLNINSVVSKINEDGTETIQGTKIEVDGTTLNTKLSTITNKQTEDSQRITQAQSQITANTNAIKLKVDEQTYTTDKKDMTNKLEKNTSEISAMKGEIALKVEQTDIENAINNIEIGSRNYIRNSNFELGTKHWIYLDGVVDYEGKKCAFQTMNQTTGETFISSDRVVNEYLRGKDITLSFLGACTPNMKSFEVYILSRRKGSTKDWDYAPAKVFKLTTSLQKYTWTYTLPADVESFYIRFDNNASSNGEDATLYIAEVKVEEGNKATGWTPTPEDVDSKTDNKINSAKAEVKVTTDKISQNVTNLSQTVSSKADGSTVSSLSNKVGYLETSVNGIKGQVSSLETTTTSISSTATNALNKANTANTAASNAQTTASNAQNTANSKAKVFTSTPTVPYKVGDLWTAGPSGELMRCKTARSSGSYTASDWEKASKYTDDTKANAVDGKVNNLQGEVSTVKSNVATLDINLQGITQRVSSTESTTTTLTSKVNTAQSTADAAKSAASTAQSTADTAKNNAATAQTTASNAQNTANSKAKVFTSTPTVPYKVGDLWTAGPSGELMRCKTARSSGSYTASDWEKASKYTDDTKANAVDGKVNNLQTDYNSTKSKVSSIETNLNGITQRVSSTEKNVTTVTNTANTANTNATNALNTANSANSKVDGLEIGGKNILKYTKDFKNWGYPPNTTNEEYNGFTVYHNKYIASSSYTDLSINNVLEPTPNTEYTLSFWAKGTGAIVSYFYPGAILKGVSSEGATTNASDGSILTHLTSQWKRYWITWTTLSSVAGLKHIILCRQQKSNSEIYIYAPKLEFGNKATDWTPAPEDTQTQIDANKTEISSTKSKVSTIETNLNGITSRVSAVETNQTTTGNKVASLESWKKEAEQNITETAITNTVKKNFYTKSETDSQITSKGYQTASQVQQTVDGLEVKVSQSGGYNKFRNSLFQNHDINQWWYWGNAQTYENKSYFTETGDMWFGVPYDNPGGLWQNGHEFEPNTEYTLSVNIGWEASVKEVKFVIEYTPDPENNGNQITSQHFGFNNKYSSRQSITFTTPSNIRYAKMGFWHGGSSNGGNAFLIHINKPCLTKGIVSVWSPNPDEVYSGITTIDKDGIKISMQDGEGSQGYTRIAHDGMEIFNGNGSRIAHFGDSNTAYINTLTADKINNRYLLRWNEGRPRDLYVAPTATGDGTGRDANNKASSISNTLNWLWNTYGCYSWQSDIVVHVAPGDYWGADNYIGGWIGSGVIYIILEPWACIRSTIRIEECSMTVVIKGSIDPYNIEVQDNAYLYLNYDGYGIYVRNSTVVVAGLNMQCEGWYGDMNTWGDYRGYGVYATDGSNVLISNCDIVGFWYGCGSSVSSYVSMLNCVGHVGCGGVAVDGGILSIDRAMPLCSSLLWRNVGGHLLDPGGTWTSNSKFKPKPSAPQPAPPPPVETWVWIENTFWASSLWTAPEGSGSGTSGRTGQWGQGKWGSYKPHRGYASFSGVNAWCDGGRNFTVELTMTRQNTSHGYAGAVPVPKIKTTNGSFWNCGKAFARGATHTVTLPSDVANALVTGGWDRLEMWAGSSTNDYSFYDNVRIRVICEKRV